MTPLYNSSYYHNYFTHDFYSIDPEFGTMDDYLNMVKEIHRRGMNFYMDTELQYVTKEHPWFKESFQNPESQYSGYVLYQDSLNQEAQTMVFDKSGLKSYDGYYTEIAPVNLYNHNVRKYITDYYAFWIDPNGDESFEDGVDGFRLDHAMDDLDNKGILTNLFEDFWKPLIQNCKAINPNVTFVAEQASWNDSDACEWMAKSGLEVAYSFGVFSNLKNPEIFNKYLTWSKGALTGGKNLFAFLDLHDTDRFASSFDESLEKNKQLAAMVYLTKFIPYIYSGQEIGMRGKNIQLTPDDDAFSDGLGIPVREPFEWTTNIMDPGMALWFEHVQPYWENRSIRSNDGISVEEQKDDPNSLLNFYRELFKLRSSNQAFTSGEIDVLKNIVDSVVAYSRWDDKSSFVLIFNLNKAPVNLTIESKDLPFKIESNWKSVFGDGSTQFESRDNSIELRMKENGFIILEN